MYSKRTSTALRLGLAYLGVPWLGIGLWALLAPRSFYADFPGAGMHWVSLLPPYNEHLVTDYGGLTLAMGALLAWGAVSLDPGLVAGALTLVLVAGVPHLVYHVTHFEGVGARDVVGQSVSLGLQVAVPAALLLVARRARVPASTERA